MAYSSQTPRSFPSFLLEKGVPLSFAKGAALPSLLPMVVHLPGYSTITALSPLKSPGLGPYKYPSLALFLFFFSFFLFSSLATKISFFLIV